MAKKTSSITPAERHLRYQLTNSNTPGTETSHYVDLARDLSAINRRLYRQGQYYYVRRVTITSRNTINGLVSVSTAPDTWVVKNSLRKSFALWKKMHAQADHTGVRQGKWNDFKVFLTDDHRTSSNILRPIDNGNNSVSSTEQDWDYATMVSPRDGGSGSPDNDEFFLHLLGDDNGSLGSMVSAGIIKGYASSRMTVQEEDPDSSVVFTSNWMTNLFDTGDHVDDISDVQKDENDSPPYDQDSYPGGSTNMPKPTVKSIAAIGSYGSSSPSVRLEGFRAPLGLLEIESQSDTPNDVFDILIELAPGTYRGVAAEGLY